MTRRGSQNTAILLHLAKGRSLTRYGAILTFRVQNLTARISELRDIVTSAVIRHRISDVDDAIFTTEGGLVMVEKTDANGQTYASYSIPQRGVRQAVGRYLATLTVASENIRRAAKRA